MYHSAVPQHGSDRTKGGLFKWMRLQRLLAALFAVTAESSTTYTVQEGCALAPDISQLPEHLSAEDVPEQLTQICPSENATIHSQSLGHSTDAVFLNQHTLPVTLLWVDPHGKEVEQGVLAPGATQRERTVQGHVYHVRSVTGALLVRCVVMPAVSLCVAVRSHGQSPLFVRGIARIVARSRIVCASGRHRVGAVGLHNPMGIPCDGLLPVKDLHKKSTIECDAIKTTFLNRAGCHLNLWWWNREC